RQKGPGWTSRHQWCRECSKAKRTVTCPGCRETRLLRSVGKLCPGSRGYCARCRSKDPVWQARQAADKVRRPHGFPRTPRECLVCHVQFFAKFIDSECCSNACGVKLKWQRYYAEKASGEERDPPPPDEATISRLCDKIRSTWTAQEERERRGARFWIVP